MSSVKHNGLEDGSHSTAALGERFEAEHDSFTADLADGLHAMAQPLTILRSTIAMLSLSTDAEPSRSRCLDISVRQIDRTCRLFASLQERVVSQLEPPDRKPIDLEELLTRKIEDHACDYQKLGVAIARAHSDKAPTA